MEGQYLLLLKLLGRDLRNNWPAWRSKWRWSLVNRLNRIGADLVKVAILILSVWLAYLMIFWELFSRTPIGNVFATRVSPGIDEYFRDVIGPDLAGLALNSITFTLQITFTVAIFAKFTGVYRLAYQNRGLISRLGWVAFCTFIAAGFFPLLPQPASLRDNAALYFLPSACLIAGVFDLAGNLAPEFTVVFTLAEFIRERLRIIRIRDLPPDVFDH